MTLNLMIHAPWGIWQSADFRITKRAQDGTLSARPNWTAKHLSVLCIDGRLQITYSGAAEIWTRVPGYSGEISTPHYAITGSIDEINRKARFQKIDVSEWLVRILHGKPRAVCETLEHIREQASRTSSFHAPNMPFPTLFVYAGYVEGKLIAGEIVNSPEPPPADRDAAPPDWDLRPPGREFFLTGFEPWAGTFLSSLGRRAVAGSERQRIFELAALQPSDPHDYLDELAAVNQRTARRKEAGGLISEECSVVHLPPEGPALLRNYTWGRDQTIKISAPRAVLHGIDLDTIGRAVLEAGPISGTGTDYVPFAFRHEQPDSEDDVPEPS